MVAAIRSPSVIKQKYKPYDYFNDFHARSQLRAILVVHRRGGKTYACVNDLVAKALRTRKERAMYGYIAPFFKQAVLIAWVLLQEAVRDIPGVHVDKTKKTVTFKNAGGHESTIALFGADNPDSIRGAYFDGVILDEVADMNRDLWDTVLPPMLMNRGGSWAVVIGTPKGNNFFYDLLEEAKKKPEVWFSMVLPASKSGRIPQAELDDYRATVDEAFYLQEMECSFSAGIRGSFYAEEMEAMEAEGRLEPITPVRAAPVHVAFDLGYNDATAAWFYQIVNGEMRFIDYMWWQRVVIDEIIHDVEKTGYRIGNWFFPHEAQNKTQQTGRSMIEHVRNLGIRPIRIPKLDRLDGIQAVRTALPKVAIDGEKCYEGVQALKSYKKKWSDKYQTYSKDPEHDWASDGADAFRYAILSVRDEDIKATAKKSKRELTPMEAKAEWEAQARINIQPRTSLTLDELYDSQPSSSYTRI